MSTYWPWWAGAIGLALVTIFYTLATDRTLGVSGAWDRVLHWRSERRLEQMEAEFADDRELAEALAAATAEHFGTVSAAPASSQAPYGGTQAPYWEPQAAPYGEMENPYGQTQTPYGQMETPYGEMENPYEEAQPTDPEVGPMAGEGPSAIRRPVPVATQAALLLSIFLGGLIASVASGRFRIRFDMGPGFQNLVTADPTTMFALLFAGGVLVGFGTRLAGGCSSGHGLSGCGRLSPVSIVATAVFFGTAVAVSFLLWKVI